MSGERSQHPGARLSLERNPWGLPVMTARWWCDRCQAPHTVPWPTPRKSGVRVAEVVSPCPTGKRLTVIKLAAIVARENAEAFRAYGRAWLAEETAIKPMRFVERRAGGRPR